MLKDNLLKLVFILFTQLFVSPAKPQKTNDILTVLDSISAQPTPFVTVCIKNSQEGLYSNQDGEFVKNKLIGKEIILSCIGYNTKTCKVNKQSQYIYLQPKQYEIKEITVKPKKPKILKLGYLKYKHLESLHIMPGCGTELAVFIKNTINKKALIKRILFDANRLSNKREIHGSVEGVLSVFKINIYKVKDGLNIGEQINTVPLIFTSDNLSKTAKINIEKHQIEFPIEGAFIAIEWIGKLDKTTNKVIKSNHGTQPSLGFTNNGSKTIVYKRNKLGNSEWSLYNKNHPFIKTINTDKYIPKISVEIIY